MSMHLHRIINSYMVAVWHNGLTDRHLYSYLLLYDKFPHLLAKNNNGHLLSHTVSVGQEFRGDLIGWLVDLGCLMRVKSICC